MPFQEDFFDDVHPLREVVKTSEEARPAWRQRCFIFSLLQSLAGTSLPLTCVSLSVVKRKTSTSKMQLERDGPNMACSYNK